MDTAFYIDTATWPDKLNLQQFLINFYLKAYTTLQILYSLLTVFNKE